MNDLLNDQKINIAPDAWLLRGFVLPDEPTILHDLQVVIAGAPLQKMMTPMGYPMSVNTTSCGDLGWVSSAKGYAYARTNPQSQLPWPKMPASFLQLANTAAATCGFTQFVPDSCLINQYAVGTKMGLHQDKDERDFSQPIVSVSLGIAATFQFGGVKRGDKTIKLALNHGDVVVWGGESRLNYHGILTIKPARHKALGAVRINLTFRKAG